MKEKIEFLHDALMIDEEILVLGDLHIGYEEYVYGESLFIRTQLKEILEKLAGMFELLDNRKIKIKKIVLLGDLKHEFGEISDSEWRDTLQFLDYLDEKMSGEGKIILVKGNHDNIAGPIVRKRNVKIVDFYKYKDVCFIHGNKMFKRCENSKTLIMGHLHPSISLRDKYKKEKYKCFLKGKWKGKDIFILPSFSNISFGLDLKEIDISKNHFLIIDNNVLKRFEVIIYNDKERKEYNFGKLGRMMEIY
jgi:uncharacterized protein